MYAFCFIILPTFTMPARRTYQSFHLLALPTTPLRVPINYSRLTNLTNLTTPNFSDTLIVRYARSLITTALSFTGKNQKEKSILGFTEFRRMHLGYAKIYQHLLKQFTALMTSTAPKKKLHSLTPVVD